MASKLRDLIRKVRACKTAAEEREVIAKESASLRTAFKDNDPKRHRNVAKLMFMHMLGYPTHFGQMECLKLIAGTEFPEKRMGYLGLMLLLDERQEVLMLVTNSIKNDLNNTNQYIIGIALCAFANLCSAEMASDLASEVVKLLQSGNPYIRKKAALCCVRIVRKVPDLADSFLNPAATLMMDKHHGVLISGVKLCTVLCHHSNVALEQLKKQTSSFVEILKNLLISGYRAEYDVSGIVDPFLQIEILQLLQLVGKGDPESSDIMSDILAQVITNTDSGKAPGNAILYQCVQTIMNIEAIRGLRVLSINILGQFLENRDNNIRYVALNMLVKVVSVDSQAIQRHRSTVMECLKDPDVSIRRRALDLVYALANESNVESLTIDLLEYLKRSDQDFKGVLTLKICSVIQKFASSKLWYIDQMANLMLEAGKFITNDLIYTLVVIISNTPELHGYTVRLLYQMFEHWTGQESLALVTIWCIGEYGEMLINHAGELDTEEPVTITELEVLDMLEAISTDLQATPTMKEFLLIAFLKLSSRYYTCTEKIQGLISKYKDTSLLELQQRAIEFNTLLGKHQNIRNSLVERIPVLNETIYQGKRADAAVAALGPAARIASPLLLRGNLGTSVESLKTENKYLTSLLDLNGEQGAPDSNDSGIGDLQDLLKVDPIPPLGIVPSKDQPIDVARTEYLLDLLSTSTPESFVVKDPALIGPSVKQQATCAIDTQPWRSVSIYSEPLSQQIFVPNLGGSGGSISSAQSVSSSDFSENTNKGQQSSGSFGHEQYEVSTTTSRLTGPMFPSIVVLQSSRLKVLFDFTKPLHYPQITCIHATYLGNSCDPCTDFMLQAAVPKYMKLKLEPASGNVLAANGTGTITQNLIVTNPMHGQKPLMMRIKIAYKVNGQDMIEHGQIENFPAFL